MGRQSGDFCGAFSNANFGKAVFSNTIDPAILRGWGTRPSDWAVGVSLRCPGQCQRTVVVVQAALGHLLHVLRADGRIAARCVGLSPAETWCPSRSGRSPHW